MRRTKLLFLTAAMLVACLPIMPIRNAAAQEAAAPAASAADPMQALKAALDQRISVEFQDTPLSDVVEFLRQQTNINIVIDTNSLDDVGLTDDQPVTLRLRELPLRSVLTIALRQLHLASTIRDGVLLITTAEAAEVLVTETFPVRDLLSTDGVWDETTEDDASLIILISTTIAPDSWDELGGAGHVESFRGMLVVTQTPEVHLEIRHLLAALRSAAAIARKHPDRPPPQTVVGDSKADPDTAKIEAALAKSLTMEFKEVPLTEVVAWVAEQTGINATIDANSFEPFGLAVDVPVSISVKNLPLRSCLRLALHPLSLTFVVRDGTLVVTTEVEYSDTTVVRVYPVADLLGKPADPNLFETDDQAGLADNLIDAITATVDPQGWNTVGGPGAIEFFAPSKALAIAQSYETHQQVESLLAGLRDKLAAYRQAAETASAAQPAEPSPLRLTVYFVPTAKPPVANPDTKEPSPTKPQPNTQSHNAPAPREHVAMIGNFANFIP